jgi:hypothetical protein
MAWMTTQEQEEMDFSPMSPYAFEEAAVQQEGHLRPAAQYLITDYDTWVRNPFWDGVTKTTFDDAELMGWPSGDDYTEDAPGRGQEESATATAHPPQEDGWLPFD